MAFFMEKFEKLFFRKNNIVVYFYIIIGPGMYSLFLKQIFYPQYSYLGYSFIIPLTLVALLGFYSFYRLVKSEPGELTHFN